MRENYHKKKKAAEEKVVIGQKDYNNMTLLELKRLGRLRKIKYCGSMDRDKIIGMLKINDEDPYVRNEPEFDKKCQKEGSKQWKKNLEKNWERGRAYYHKKREQITKEVQSEWLFYFGLGKIKRSVWSFWLDFILVIEKDQNVNIVIFYGAIKFSF